jgi:RNA polymerase sigma-70 factor (ECF subfamily)
MRDKSENTSVLFVWNKMKAGDEQSLSWLFAYFYSDLYFYGIKIFKLPDLVKDSIQDIFSRIWEKRETLGDVQNPKAYLIASLRRKLFQNIQSDYPALHSGLPENEEQPEFSFETYDFLEKEELSAQLRKALVQALTGLSPKQRELIYLRFYHRLRYLEIARIMNVNEQTVKNLMQRTLAKLREKIDSDLRDGIQYMDGLIITLLQIFSGRIAAS